jgi:ABC transport system ATP-binding/permease protein
MLMLDENFYKRLIQVFAIVASENYDRIGKAAENFLIHFFESVPLNISQGDVISDFRLHFERFNQNLNYKRISANAVKLIRFAEALNSELSIAERHMLLIRLFEFVNVLQEDKSQAMDFISLLSDIMDIEENDHKKLLSFCLQEENSVDVRFMMISPSELYYFLPRLEMLENPDLFVEKQVQPFEYHHEMQFIDGRNFNYQKLRESFEPEQVCYSLTIENLSVKYNRHNELFNGLNISIDAPGMLAVMGGSGAGKTTFLKSIALNKQFGTKLYSDKKQLKIAYIPQEDHIEPDVPLCKQLAFIRGKYGFCSSEFLLNDTLSSLQLMNYKHVKPGSIQESRLSGGERKRFGIACSLMTYPDVLLCDEPTSGLSLSDAEQLIRHLREIANTDKFIICSIHQPEQHLLNYFEKILFLDEGGNPVYYGCPDGFYTYVTSVSGVINEDSGLIKHSRNQISSAETILRSKQNIRSESSNRKFSPLFWKQHFQQNHPIKLIKNIPEFLFLQQKIGVAFIQDFLKIKHRPGYFSLVIMYAPIMAVFLALVSKSSGGENYIPSMNIHLPVFFMMSIVVAIFGGLVFSLTEMSREQAERKREFVLEASNHRYYLVKVLRFFSISVVHALLFSFFACLILEIWWMFFQLAKIYLFIMFLSILTGMTISILSNGKTWAYISIPIIIIPQIVFSGALISWSDFPGFKEQNQAPVISRFIPSALAFESLLVESIYQHPNFNFEQERMYYTSLLYLQYVIPEMENEILENYDRKEDLLRLLHEDLPLELKPIVYQKNGLKKIKQQFNYNMELYRDSRVKILPELWNYLQNYSCHQPVIIKENTIQKQIFPYYQTGNWRSDKSVFVQVFGIEMRHVNYVLLWIGALIILNVLLLFSGLLQWPYNQKFKSA